jgi:YegS/Rv2252/BmrU family lipid kinase
MRRMDSAGERHEIEARERARERARPRRAVLIVNARARQGADVSHRAAQLLKDKGFTVHDTIALEDASRLAETVARAVAQKPPYVVIGGGDGTISAALEALAYSDVACGLLPLGTANSFARSLKLPLDLEGAVDVIAGGRALAVDLGRINEHYFATAAAIGLSAAISRHKPHRLKMLLGRLAYPAVAARILPRFRAFQCTVRHGTGAVKHYPAVLELRIANAPHEGGVEAAPEADVTSGDLVVHVVTGRSKWRLLKTWGKIVGGLEPDGPGFESMRLERFHLETEPSHDVNIDGETAMRTPVEVSIARKALTVLVPPESIPPRRR